jgi:phosphonoacetate hydrolase
MPNLRQMADTGFETEVRAVFPTVTKVNNVPICTGAWPADHGIIGNSFYDPESGGAVYTRSSPQNTGITAHCMNSVSH